MIKKYCSSCYFSEICSDDAICEDYISLDEQLADETIDELIQERRTEFRREWRQYITRWDT